MGDSDASINAAAREERARRERAARMARILGASALPAAEKPAGSHAHEAARAFVRAESEDDDGYDPYSDRPAPAEPLYETDPWA